jgi:hypothetical protein
LKGRSDIQKQQQAQGGKLYCSCLGCQRFRGFRKSKQGSSSGTGMEVAKGTFSSSVDPLLHLFFQLLSESCFIQQGEAIEALFLSLQGQQRSLERSWGLELVAKKMTKDRKTQGIYCWLHKHAIEMKFKITCLYNYRPACLNLEACRLA